MPWWFWLFLAWNILNTILIQILHLTTPTMIRIQTLHDKIQPRNSHGKHI
jgi:hypothetical protein